MTATRADRPILHEVSSLGRLSGRLSALIRGRLWLQVLIGMLLGLFTGILLGPSTGWVPAERALVIGNWLALPGQLFLTLIQMIVIPLIFASIIRGLAAGDTVQQLRKLGVRAVVFFVVTTAIATVVGLRLADWIEPGRYVEIERAAVEATATAPAPAAQPAARPDVANLPDKLLNLLPKNPLVSMVEGQMLQVVLFAIIFGVALVSMSRDQARPLLDVLGSLQEVCMTIVRWAMWLAPYAVFGLMAQLGARIGLDALLGMAVYVLTVLAGLLVMLGIYLLFLRFFVRMRPLAFLRATRDVLLLAFSTSSSAAVMPLSIKTAEERLGVRSSVAQFVIPLGATINMNGTALYQGVAAMFLAQVYGIDIGLDGMALIVVMAVGAAIGSPGTPGVGIAILAMVLGAVGIPASGIALIMGVDRLLDMARTAINVCGDLVAAKLMDHWLGTPEEPPVAAADTPPAPAAGGEPS